jgi:DNA-binding beta-propeller fold protein YncE
MPNFRVQRFTPQGGFLGAYPNPAQPPPRGGFNIPRGVAVDNAGNMFVSDTYNWRIQKLDPAGNWIYDWGRRGRGDFEFNYTRMIATDPRNNDVVVADTDNHTIKKYSSDGKTLRWKIGGLGRNPGQFRNPHGVDVGADGRVYVADTRNGRVQILSADGRPERAFGSEGTGTGQFKFPRGIAVDASGDIYVSDSARGLIQRFSNTGAYENKIGTSGTADNQLDQPFDVETTSDLVIVADTAANKIKVWRKDGSFVGAYGSRGKSLGQMIKPQGLDMRGNILYICDSENERILKWQLNIS